MGNDLDEHGGEPVGLAVLCRGVVCIDVVLAFHLLVYRLPALLATYIVALLLSGVYIVLDVVRDREALREREDAQKNGNCGD